MRLFGIKHTSQIWYYLTVCTPSIIFCATIISFWKVIFDSSFATIPWYLVAVVCGMFLSVVVHCITSLCGMLLYGDPEVQNRKNEIRFDKTGWDADKRLIVSFVSQGLQVSVLRDSVKQAYDVLTELGVNFEIEVVVDSAPLLDRIFESLGCVVVDVPRAYRTKSGARFKARSLCYAAEQRLGRYSTIENAWVLHCDEDTLISRQAIVGVHKFLSIKDADQRCGAGEKKLYSPTGPSRSAFYRFVDFHCTGEDLGRYRLQFKMWQASVFGAHGSFVVMPLKVETPELFEVGEKGSLTEDVYAAMRLRVRGIPVEWIDGHVYEQAPHDLRNFLLQRARWIHGIINLFLEREFPINYRMIWFTYTSMWRTAMLTGLVFLLVLLNLEHYPWILALWGSAATAMGTVVTVGALRNTEDDPNLSAISRIGRLLRAFLTAPIVSLMETGAVLYAVVYRPSSFYVVEKRIALVQSAT